MNVAIWRHRACVSVVATAALIFAGATLCAQTLKERLSDKASDQQRVDNCRVPPERRGPVPRPDCPQPDVTKPR
jgi:hypothetical protein